MKTWTLKINEEEMKAMLAMHLSQMLHDEDSAFPNTERSARIHDLTKRLNKDTPDIEEVKKAQPQEAPKAATGW